MNVPMEYGPYSNIMVPTGAGHLQPTINQAFSGQSSLPMALGQAVSTGRAIAGVAGTAMSQLQNLQNGVPQGMVFFDLTARLR